MLTALSLKARSAYKIRLPVLISGRTFFKMKIPYILQLEWEKETLSSSLHSKFQLSTSVLLRAVQKLQRLEAAPACLRFLCMDAENLSEVFSPNEVSRIYLNFSDPWPKKRHARRRLTSRQFLSLYDQILASHGTLEFKTDNKLLFDFSLEELPEAHWNLDSFTYDLHQDAQMNQNNIMTEYEKKFSALGNPIYKFIASR